MYKIIVTACLLFVALAGIGPAQAQDVWNVFGQLDLLDLDNPSNFASDSAALVDQPKVGDYPDFMAASDVAIGSATVAYTKDADPYGEFVLNVSNDLDGILNTYCVVGHAIEPVVGADWEVQCWLEIELVDRNGGGVTLETGYSPDLLRMQVQNAGGTFVGVDGMILGEDIVLDTAGTHNLDAGVRVYAGPEAQAMEVLVEFNLSAGDQATVTGRFEINQDLTPVETSTWSGVKQLFR